MARTKFLDDIRGTGLDAREVDKPKTFATGFGIQVYPHISLLPLHSLRITFDPQDPKTPRVHARGVCVANGGTRSDFFSGVRR